MTVRLCALVILWALLLPAVSAGTVSAAPDQDYLLLVTQRERTMEDELDQAVALGFRVITGAPSRTDEIAFLLERSELPPVPGLYRLISASGETGFQNELNQAADEGYRLIASTIMWRKCDLVALLERHPVEDGLFEYSVLSTHRTSTLEKELNGSTTHGFSVVRLLQSNENVAVLERRKQ